MASSLDNSHSLWWKYFYKFIFQDSEIEAKKLKAENGKHEENGEEEEDAEEEEDIGEEEEDLDGEGEDDLDEEDGGEGNSIKSILINYIFDLTTGLSTVST